MICFARALQHCTIHVSCNCVQCNIIWHIFKAVFARWTNTQVRTLFFRVMSMNSMHMSLYTLSWAELQRRNNPHCIVACNSQRTGGFNWCRLHLSTWVKRMKMKTSLLNAGNHSKTGSLFLDYYDELRIWKASSNNCWWFLCMRAVVERAVQLMTSFNERVLKLFRRMNEKAYKYENLLLSPGARAHYAYNMSTSETSRKKTWFCILFYK